MLAYNVVHHVPGRIRVEVPSIKRLPLRDLKKLFAAVSLIPTPIGIRDIRTNLLSCSLVIEYDPNIINILEYLKEMASHKDLLKALDRRSS